MPSEFLIIEVGRKMGILCKTRSKTLHKQGVFKKTNPSERLVKDSAFKCVTRDPMRGYSHPNIKP